MSTSQPANGRTEREIIKILVLGCANVGKSSLIQRYTQETFTGKRRPTVGADFSKKHLTINDTDVLLQIWDTAGQERFHQGSLASTFYRGAHGALLVYDVTNETSIEQLAQWRDEAMEKIGPTRYFPIVVVGNKVDLRVDPAAPSSSSSSTTTTTTATAEDVSSSPPPPQSSLTATVLQWCRENGYGHIETSAKDGNGVTAAMLTIAALALEARGSDPDRNSASAMQERSKRISLHKQHNNNGYQNLSKMYSHKKSGCGDGCGK